MELSYAYNTNYDPPKHTDLANAVTRAGITLGPNMNHRIYLDTIFNAGPSQPTWHTVNTHIFKQGWGPLGLLPVSPIAPRASRK